MKENKETILQLLGANIRISCLQLDLFPVYKAMF